MNPPLDPNHIELLDAETVAILKSKSPAEKFAMAFASNRLVRLRLAGRFRTKHPEWIEEEIQAAIARSSEGSRLIWSAWSPSYLSS